MSDGRTHAIASVILSAGFGLGAAITGDATDLLYSAGSLIGVLVSPDCDVDNGFIADRIIRNRLGRIFEAAWDGLWYMYRRSLKHGGELSHFPVISTIGRIAYLYLLLVAVPHFAIYFSFHPGWDLWYVLRRYADLIVSGYKVVLGLAGSDFIHYALDVLTKEKSG